jgi:hypothetical protein
LPGLYFLGSGRSFNQHFPDGSAIQPDVKNISIVECLGGFDTNTPSSWRQEKSFGSASIAHTAIFHATIEYLPQNTADF